MSDEQQEANARLIAAAPETAAERDRLREINAELLAVLEDIARGPLQEPQPFEEYAKIRARKAIAKATGEESA